MARTCALTGSTLHLVEPLGFSLEDRYLKRAGLDYWDKLTLKVYPSFETLQENYQEAAFFFFSTRASAFYTPVNYLPGSFLVFGSETKGLPAVILDKFPGSLYRVPMKKGTGRSLNLSNTAALVLYEALRINGFPNMQ